MNASCVHPEGGGGGQGSDPPPPIFDRDWVLCTCLWIEVAVQRLFLSYYYQLFIIKYYTYILHLYILSRSMFSMERSSFLYISLIQIKKRIQFPIPCIYEMAFSYFSCLELHEFTPFKAAVSQILTIMLIF